MENKGQECKLRKIRLIVPFLIMPIITPFYIILDSVFLVDVFGCGCVPIAQTNMFNIPYNANDLRWTVYGILTVLMTVLGVRFSRLFEKKIFKVIYVLAAALFNLMLACWICKAYMWG